MAKRKDLDQAIETLRSVPDQIDGIAGQVRALLGQLEGIGSVQRQVANAEELIKTKLGELDDLNGQCEGVRAGLTEDRRKAKDAEAKGKAVLDEARTEAEKILSAARRQAKETVTKAEVEAGNIKRTAEVEAETVRRETADEIKTLEAKKAQAENGAAAAQELLDKLNAELNAIRKAVA